MKLFKATATATVLLAGLSTVGATSAQAWTIGDPEMTLSSSLTVDGPEGGGYGVTYRLTITDPHHTEGKSFFHMACSPALGSGTILSQLPNWSPFDCASNRVQVNDLYKIGDGLSETTVVHFVVTDLARPASISVTSEYSDTPGTTASTDSAPLTVTSSYLPKAQLSTPYWSKVEVSRFTPSTFSATGLDAAGLRINPHTGVISGTPTARGDFPVTVTAQNSSGGPDATRSFSLKVVGAAPVFPSTAISGGQVGVPYSYTLAATGAPAQFKVDPNALPAGLNLDKTTGTISGTPTKAREYHFIATAVNEGGSTSATLDMTVVDSNRPDDM